MSSSAQAALFHGPNKPFQIASFDIPNARPGEIIVQVTGCTLCGSDLHTCAGHRQVETPTVLGHEIIGRISGFGTDSPQVDYDGQPLKLGDRVTWGVAISCGQCFFCDRDLPQKCEYLHKYGHAVFDGRPDGGLASHVVLRPGTAILKIPDSLSDEVANPANCATATVSAAINAVPTLKNRTALVIGGGMLGLSACAMLKVAGATVICAEPSEERRGLARRFGAAVTVAPNELSQTISELTQQHGVDAAFEFSGNSAAIESGLATLRTGGTYVLIGAVFPVPALSILPEQFIRRHLTMIGIHNYAPKDLSQALRFLADHPEFPFQEVVDRWFPLAEIESAISHAKTPGVLRVGIRP